MEMAMDYRKAALEDCRNGVVAVMCGGGRGECGGWQ
jgi:hypothetical protein